MYTQKKDFLKHQMFFTFTKKVFLIIKRLFTYTHNLL